MQSSGPRGQRQLSHLERIYGRALVEAGRSELALNHWESARAVFERALAVGQRNQLPGIMGLAHQGLAVVANRTRDFPSAG